MALRNRFRSLLGLDRSSKDFPDGEVPESSSDIVYKDDSREFQDDPRTNDEVLETIAEVYFSDSTFDASDHELQKLTEKPLVLEDLDEYRNTLRQQLQSVSKKLYTKVLENHSAYVQELQRVMELQEALQNASTICDRGRRQLDRARCGVSVGGLGILAKHRKKQHLLNLMDSLKTIKTLQRTDIRLKEMLEVLETIAEVYFSDSTFDASDHELQKLTEKPLVLEDLDEYRNTLRQQLQSEEDYPGAINLCLECEKAARSYKHYLCISELSSNLQETLIDIEKQLSVALTRTCCDFDAAHYERLQTAFRYLGKTQIAMDQMIIHFMNHINQVSFAVINNHLEGDASDCITDDGQQHVHYSGLCKKVGVDQFTPCLLDLCKKVGVDQFTPCLLDLCKSLWSVMLNYHKVMQWHERYDPAMHVTGSDITGDGTDDEKNAEATYNRNYIRQKLDHGLNRIWKEVQERIKAHLLGTDLSYFKYDDFIYVLDLVNRLIAVGGEFCSSKAEDLHESIRTQTVKYFKNYH
ncbi:predicted protein, partial [Nematostella vectensis]